MSEKMRESMSALMDGETTDFEMRRLLESMDTPELRDTWARYHLASAAMKRDAAAVLPHIDISAAVSEAIAKEEVLVESRSRPMKTVAGFATAATIAFATVIGVQSYDSGNEQRGMNSIAAVSPPMARAAQTTASAGSVRYSAPVTGPSATLASSGVINPGPSLLRSQSGFQAVSLSTDHDSEVSAASHQQAAQRQLETYLVRHAELAGSWRPAATEAGAAQADNASGAPQGHSDGSQWRARWLPNGYRLVAVNNDVASDSMTPVLTSVYSNGLAAFSVFVSAAHDEPAMDLRRGATIACSRRIQSSGSAYTATVVGEIPQLAAERVATSVYQIPQQ